MALIMAAKRAGPTAVRLALSGARRYNGGPGARTAVQLLGAEAVGTGLVRQWLAKFKPPKGNVVDHRRPKCLLLPPVDARSLDRLVSLPM